ncbi:hypothetical protein HW555_007794 [Spodoptera exigua]|uniref:Uncharacterized protein n=1 Tax=Spodoptera exigua TaxID=7107 RepID=A0A835GC49_SPOEX|nr:hypothetical protein HW555_007794 [Spodoptera exigua]
MSCEYWYTLRTQDSVKFIFFRSCKIRIIIGSNDDQILTWWGTGTEEEYLHLRSRLPALVPAFPVVLDRLPPCESISSMARDRVPVTTEESLARVKMARLSAYFSVCPPAVPVHLVPVSALPKLPTLQPRLSTPPPPQPAVECNMRCKNAVLSVLCGLMSTLPLPLSPPASPAAPTSPLMPTSPVSQTSRTMSPASPALSPASPTWPKTPETPPISTPRGVKRIRRFNRNLLPSALAKEQNTDSTDSASSTDSSNNGARQRQHQRPRHVATQARIKNEPIDESQKGEQERATDEWLGGVRALRDSHVRLVLRQLRHIERLNRALDRACPRRPRNSRRTRSTHPRPR